MANRFTDSRKYRDPWFRKLKSKYKLIWDFMIHECDHAGIWKVDFELASFSIGENYTHDEVANVLKNKIYVTPKGDWFIPKFVEFQYGTLNPENRVHLSVINILKSKGAYKGLTSTIQGCKDYDKVKVKDKDKDIISKFNLIWAKYPNKLGRKGALVYFSTAIKAGKDIEEIEKALNNYLNYIKIRKIEERYIKQGNTWFNNWEDWVNYDNKIKPKSRTDTL